MKARTLLIGTAFVLGVTGARAQWVVTDPGNLAQSIINMSDNIAHTSKKDGSQYGRKLCRDSKDL